MGKSQRLSPRAGFYARLITTDDVRHVTRLVFTGLLAVAGLAAPLMAHAVVCGPDTQPDPVVTITSPASGAVLAPAPQNIPFTVTATGGVINKVSYYSAGALIGSSTTSPFSFTWNNVPSGNYTITAQATATASGCVGVGAMSSPVVLRVDSPPSVSVRPASPGTVLTAPATFTFTATASDGDGTVQQVRWYANGTLISGSITTAPYTFTWSNVAAGSYAITAAAMDNNGVWTTSAPVTVVSNDKPSSTLSTSNATSSAPGAITLQTTASDSQGGVANVQYFANGSSISSAVTAAPYTFNWTGVAAGTYSIVARATDSYGVSTDSAPYSFTVAPPSAATVAMNAPASGAQYAPGSAVNMAATVTPNGATISTVEFFDGSTRLGQGTLSNGRYVWTWANPAAGSHTLTAKLTDTAGLVNVSAGVPITVSAANPLIAVPPTSSGTGVVGRTPGQLSVSKAGQANYTIPIAVPPGTNNMVPQLALQYANGGANGLMGVGWSLTGLGQITRCMRDWTHDGYKLAVALTGSDAYCLDGQRLILVAGTYGAVNSEYRTEVHNFSRVIASAAARGNGPASFTVIARDGTKYEYGTSTGSQQVLPGEPSGTPAAWALSKVTDPRGNYYTVTYTDSTAYTGQQVPLRIDYTGNANAALSTYNSVQFVYDNTRSDVEWQYLAGYKIANTLRLTQVLTYNGTTLVKRYILGYQTSTPTARTRMASVTECSGGGSCLPATTFNWEDTSLTTYGATITYPDPTVEFGSGFTGDGGNTYWVDLNGDGRADHCRAGKHLKTPDGATYDTEVLFCALTQPSGSPTIVSLDHFPANTNYQFLDVNGDGITDVCDPVGYCWLMGPSGPTGTKIAVPLPLYYPANIGQWMDVNGDGLIDYCRLAPTGDLSCALGTGGGSFGAATSLGTYAAASCLQATSPTHCAPAQFTWANLSGDTQWFCRVENSAMRCQKWTSAGLSPEVVTPAGTDLGLSGGRTWWADVNGDGKDDFCRVLSDGSSRMACTLSTGIGFGDTVYTSSSVGTMWAFMNWADINGDGKADLCRSASASATTTDCTLSMGNAFGATVTYPIGVEPPNSDQLTGTASGFADANADGRTDACNYSQCVTAAGKAPDSLLSVTDGLGATSSIDYGNLSDSSIYTKGSGSTFPLVEVADASFVVKAIHQPNGIGGTLDTSYKYEWLRNHLQGRGSFGFAATVATDPMGTATRTQMSQTFPYVTLPTDIAVTNGGTTLSDTVQSYSATAGPAYAVFPTQTIAKSYDLNGVFINWVETTNSNFDAYNNPQQVDVVYKQSNGTADGFSSTSVITYQNDTTNWILGLPTSVAITRRMPGKPDSTRTTTTSYYAANPGLGLPQQKIVEPNNGGLGVTNLKLTTAYTYDSKGNLLTRVVSGANIATRTEVTNAYDTQGRFATSITNALNQQEFRTYDPALGSLLTVTDVNGLTTTMTYDAFGRIATQVRPDNTQLTYDRKPCVNCVASSAYVTYRTDTVTATGATVAPYVRTYSDVLDREVFNVQPGFNGADTYVRSTYDSLGRLQYRSKPFYNTDPAIRQVQYFYDALGRVYQVNTPDGNAGTAVATTTTTYNGRTRTVTNNSNVSFSKTVDSQGNVISVVDAQGAAEQSSVVYEYDQWGNLTKTTDAAGNVTTITYDLLGRKTQIADPDMGVRNFTSIDNLGQVLTSVDANGQTTTFTYDLLGRMTSRTEADLISNWYYEADSSGVACTKGVGKLCQVMATNGYSRRYVYDSLGRASSLTTHIDADYTGSWTYDAAGRLATKTYPASTGSPLSITYNYNNLGLLQSLTDTAAGTPYWTKNTDNSDGSLVQETYGNGLIGTRGYDFNTGRVTAIQAGPIGSTTSVQNQTFGYDSLGRMTARADAILATSETFTYDALNRLYSTVLNAPGVSGGSQSSTFTYDAIGNITSKSGVGTYSYTAGKPHAVSGVNGTVNGVSMPAYTYDANGNMQTDGTRSFTWTSFNMPLVISKTATAGSPGSGNASFNYGAEHQRVQQVWSSGGQNSTTIYLNEFDFEKVIDGSGSTYKHYVKAGDRIVASVVRTSGGTTVSYILPDHLASTSVVTDASGAVTDRMAYDPWGDRRFATGSVGASDPTNTIQPTSINRGYTGHEMLDQGNLGLIHMNGRVYDPTLGRFISADPFIQDPYATRSFNRYAYVWNGPLDSTDPSGFVCIAPCTVTVTGSSAIGVGFAGLASSASAMWGWSSANWGWARVTTLLMRTPTALVVTGFLKPSTLNANEAEELAKMHALQDKMLADLVETQADQAQQALSESSNGEADSKKGPPNPNGRNGGQAHQDGVKQAEQELRDKYADDPDVEVRTEVRVRTPGGDKENRFIDVAAVDKKTGQVIEGVQVGKETQAGNPVAREQRAINDISRASPSTDISFRPYNR